MDYYSKYLKYKAKYLDLKNQLGKGYKAKGKDIPCEQFSSQISAKDYNSSCPDTQPNKPFTKTKEYDQFIKDLKQVRDNNLKTQENIFREAWDQIFSNSNIAIDVDSKTKVRNIFNEKAKYYEIPINEKYYNELLLQYQNALLRDRATAISSSRLKGMKQNSPRSHRPRK